MRLGEELPLERLSAWFGEPLSVEQFTGGHSNLTYLLRAASGEYVLRRPPLGPVPPKAHDMAREFQILSLLHPLFAPAPEALRLCEDPGVIGAVFYIMERRRGRIFHNPNDAPEPHRVSELFIDCLVGLHSIDARLVPIGKPEGFLERQVGGWSERWLRAETDDRPDAGPVMQYLRTAIPVPQAAAVVHNDYKLDNLMFSESMDRVSAVLDWEMTTLGDPLADLGLTLCYWTIGSAYDPPRGRGWFTREELIARYAERTGFDVSRIGWYETLGVFKLAVILQQIYVRWVRGQTQDERFRDFGARVAMLVRRATELTER